jgi:hypothetical protein
VLIPSDTAGHRGLDVAGARTMLAEAEFVALMLGNDGRVPPDPAPPVVVGC